MYNYYLLEIKEKEFIILTLTFFGNMIELNQSMQKMPEIGEVI